MSEFLCMFKLVIVIIIVQIESLLSLVLLVSHHRQVVCHIQHFKVILENFDLVRVSVHFLILLHLNILLSKFIHSLKS